jgi:hypothetical protein
MHRASCHHLLPPPAAAACCRRLLPPAAAASAAACELLAAAVVSMAVTALGTWHLAAACRRRLLVSGGRWLLVPVPTSLPTLSPAGVQRRLAGGLPASGRRPASSPPGHCLESGHARCLHPRSRETPLLERVAGATGRCQHLAPPASASLLPRAGEGGAERRMRAFHAGVLPGTGDRAAATPMPAPQGLSWTGARSPRRCRGGRRASSAGPGGWRAAPDPRR